MPTGAMPPDGEGPNVEVLEEGFDLVRQQLGDLGDEVEILEEGFVEPNRSHQHVVRIDNEDSGRTINIRAGDRVKINRIIELMYGKFRLDPEPTDRLNCIHDGEDVFAFRALTLGEYLAAGHCSDLIWGFSSDTGGA
jgi:hypothetical protein